MNHDYKIITECRCCKSNKLCEVLDLNTQPLANAFHNGSVGLSVYPLKLNMCPYCFHSQLSVVVNPAQMFEHYLYRSGTPKTFNTYCEWFVEFVEKETKIGTVLDIACNDGTQLSKFKNRGWKVYGIDPAKNLYETSSKVANKIIPAYFNKESILDLGIDSYDAITAQNVFAHIDDIDTFLNNCKSIMNKNTRLYIQTSQADMIELGQFDTIYHEHLSFFSTRSMKTVCLRNGLYLVSVRKVDIHGVSYVFTIMTTDDEEDNSVSENIMYEQEVGRYSMETYTTFANQVTSIINKTKSTIEDYIKRGYLIIGYGAAAKGNTFLNASMIKPHFIIDDNELKYHTLTPGSNSIVVNSEFIELCANNVLFVPLSWNFYEEITQKIQNKLKTLTFSSNFSYEILQYYPNFMIKKIEQHST